MRVWNGLTPSDSLFFQRNSHKHLSSSSEWFPNRFLKLPLNLNRIRMSACVWVYEILAVNYSEVVVVTVEISYSIVCLPTIWNNLNSWRNALESIIDYNAINEAADLLLTGHCCLSTRPTLYLRFAIIDSSMFSKKPTNNKFQHLKY